MLTEHLLGCCQMEFQQLDGLRGLTVLEGFVLGPLPPLDSGTQTLAKAVFTSIQSRPFTGL